MPLVMAALALSEDEGDSDGDCSIRAPVMRCPATVIWTCTGPHRCVSGLPSYVPPPPEGIPPPPPPDTAAPPPPVAPFVVGEPLPATVVAGLPPLTVVVAPAAAVLVDPDAVVDEVGPIAVMSWSPPGLNPASSSAVCSESLY